MLDATARSLIAVIRDAVGRYLAPVTALFSLPVTFLMSNHAYYFGFVPVPLKAAPTPSSAAAAR